MARVMSAHAVLRTLTWTPKPTPAGAHIAPSNLLAANVPVDVQHLISPRWLEDVKHRSHLVCNAGKTCNILHDTAFETLAQTRGRLKAVCLAMGTIGKLSNSTLLEENSSGICPSSSMSTCVQ